MVAHIMYTDMPFQRIYILANIQSLLLSLVSNDIGAAMRMIMIIGFGLC
jgi:hypothetical protein